VLAGTSFTKEVGGYLRKGKREKEVVSCEVLRTEPPTDGERVPKSKEQLHELSAMED
jgi:hypothetical protein